MLEQSKKRTLIDILWAWVTLVPGYPVVFVLALLGSLNPRKARESVQGEAGRKAAAEWGESLVVAFLLAMVIKMFLFQPFVIPSGSMRMTLLERDRLFVNKLAYGPLVPLTKVRIPGFVKPKRGDVIVFRYPVTRDKDFIKRLIAFGGETVEIRDGRIVINGTPVTEGPLAARRYSNMGPYGAEGRPVTVPGGQLFVMGDNTDHSHDSRFWGFVPEELVIGRADVIFWPLTRVGRIR